MFYDSAQLHFLDQNLKYFTLILKCLQNAISASPLIKPLLSASQRP